MGTSNFCYSNRLFCRTSDEIRGDCDLVDEYTNPDDPDYEVTPETLADWVEAQCEADMTDAKHILEQLAGRGGILQRAGWEYYRYYNGMCDGDRNYSGIIVGWLEKTIQVQSPISDDYVEFAIAIEFVIRNGYYDGYNLDAITYIQLREPYPTDWQEINLGTSDCHVYDGVESLFDIAYNRDELGLYEMCLDECEDEGKAYDRAYEAYYRIDRMADMECNRALREADFIHVLLANRLGMAEYDQVYRMSNGETGYQKVEIPDWTNAEIEAELKKLAA